MPIYEFRSDDGRVIERFFRMADEKPEVVVKDGVPFRRVWNNHRINDGSHKVYPYVSKGLARTEAAGDCRHVDVTVGKKHKRKVPMPVVESPRHERELCAKHGLERE